MNEPTDSTRLATLVEQCFGPVNAFVLAAIYANEPRCTRLARQLDCDVALPGEVAREAIRLAVTTMAEWGVAR